MIEDTQNVPSFLLQRTVHHNQLSLSSLRVGVVCTHSPPPHAVPHLLLHAELHDQHRNKSQHRCRFVTGAHRIPLLLFLFHLVCAAVMSSASGVDVTLSVK